MAQINKPSDYFNTKLWTGDGSSSRSITGVGFQPDLVWLKGRSIINDHTLYDSVRGAGLNKELSSDGTEAEGGLLTEQYGYISSIDSDGFSGTAGVSGSDPVDYFNESGSNYVAWNWLGGGTASSNTDGSITSTVSANTTSGFSIVSYTSNASGQDTVGHGLGVAPNVIITKSRDGGTFNWSVFHSSVCDTTSKFLILDGTAALSTYSTIWGASLPTSSVFGITSGVGVEASDNCIAYCFAEKKGYSKFGKYTGNGSSDGTFVYTGFKPAFVITKCTSTSSIYTIWGMWDNKRNAYNVSDNVLASNTSEAENTGNIGTQYIDMLSNGFKCRNNGSPHNISGASYIYMAFAENPLVGTNNIPTTAR